MNLVGELIRHARLRRGWSFGDLARACGASAPRQVSRTSQRLVVLEREGVLDQTLLQKVVAALDVDSQLVVEVLDRQRAEELEEWNRWADEHAPVELHIRPFAGLWIKLNCPKRSRPTR